MSDSSGAPTTTTSTHSLTTPAATMPYTAKSPALKSLAPLPSAAASASSASASSSTASNAATAASSSSSSSTHAHHTNNDSTSSSSSSSSHLPSMQLDNGSSEDGDGTTKEHLLHQKWAFWYDLKDTNSKPNQNNWGASLRKLYAFETIESFWGMFNNIAKPSAIPIGSDYHLFRYDIKPEWEDPKNRNGGKWVLETPKGEAADLDQIWQSTLIGLIGELFTDENEVNGVVVSMRKGRNRIGLWTQSESRAAVMRVGTEWKKMMNLPSTIKLGFQSHAQAMKKSSHDIQNQYTV